MCCQATIKNNKKQIKIFTTPLIWGLIAFLTDFCCWLYNLSPEKFKIQKNIFTNFFRGSIFVFVFFLWIKSPKIQKQKIFIFILDKFL
jgi:hypothetical protein